jgi:hypothetical protein
VNRSLRELKFTFMALFPLLCAGRALERLNLFLIEPSVAQQAMFGKIVAYPWQIRSVDSWFGEDGVSMGWRYRLSAFPTPLKQCRADDWAKGENGSDPASGCGLEWNGGYMATGWKKGELWMKFDPPHIASSWETEGQ